MTSSKRFEKFDLSVATARDNQEIIEHVKKNPIRMEMDYFMDRHDDFFKVQKILQGSKVLIAKTKDTKEIVGCVSFLKLEGMVLNEKIPFHYITDLIKDQKKRSPLMMKDLLNLGLGEHFDSDLVFGLINGENKAARIFSNSDRLLSSAGVTATFNYYEIIPLSKHRIPKRYKIQSPTDAEALQDACNFINDHYKNYLLFRQLDLQYLEVMFKYLPNFNKENIVMLYEEKNLKGVMIIYNPSEVVSLIISRMDKRTKMLVKFLKAINSFTGLLFSPPQIGEKIKTLQVRHLAGTKKIQRYLLSYANNLAYHNKLHTVSMLADERDEISIHNCIVYKYKSLMYTSYKKPLASKIDLFKDRLVYFDISYS